MSDSKFVCTKSDLLLFKDYVDVCESPKTQLA